VLEIHHDENGIIWPVSIAPYAVHLVSLSTDRTPEVTEAANAVYAQLVAGGVETLYDDRNERAGVKFNDADLLGLPLRLTVGKRGIENGVAELKIRRTGETSEIPLDALVSGIKTALEQEQVWINAMLKDEPMA
jgi:prolyl-tRNA synthetase